MDISVESIVIIVVGIFLCFGGWYLFRFSVYFIGVIVGASTGYSLAVLAFRVGGQHLSTSWEPWIIFLSMVVFAFVGVILIKTLVKVVLFIAGFLFGIVTTSIYSGGVEEFVQPYGIEMILKNPSIWSVIAGVAFGILFIFFEKWFVILYTCAVGAYLVMAQLAAPPIVFYALLVVGCIVQFWISKGARVRNLRINGTDSD